MGVQFSGAPLGVDVLGSREGSGRCSLRPRGRRRLEGLTFFRDRRESVPGGCYRNILLLKLPEEGQTLQPTPRWWWYAEREPLWSLLWSLSRNSDSANSSFLVRAGVTGFQPTPLIRRLAREQTEERRLNRFSDRPTFA